MPQNVVITQAGTNFAYTLRRVKKTMHNQINACS